MREIKRQIYQQKNCARNLKPPQDDLIIVRLGNQVQKSTKGSPHDDDFFVFIDETYNMLAQRK